MTTEELALEVVERLEKEYPDAGCTLDYNRSMETTGQCQAGSTVYRCKSECSSKRFI